MPTIRLRVTNSLDGATVATSANASVAKVADADEFYVLNTLAGGSFADIGVIPLQFLRDNNVLTYQDYVVNAYIDTTAAAGVTLFQAAGAAIEGAGGSIYPISRPRSTDPSPMTEGRLSQIHLAGPDYAVQLLTTGAVGVQLVVLEFIPVERVSRLDYNGVTLDGPDVTEEIAADTNNTQLKADLDIVSAIAATVRYVHSGPTVTVDKLAAVIQAGTIAAGNATITWTIGGVPITGGVNTLVVGDTVDDTNIVSPTGANVMAEGAVLVGTVGGGNTAAASLAAVSMALSPV